MNTETAPAPLETAPAPAPALVKWEAGDVGPRQASAFNKALSSLRSTHTKFVELRGVVGVSERRTVLWSPFSPTRRAEVTAAEAAIQARFGHVVTRANANAITTALESAARQWGAADTLPIVDKRETPEARAEADARFAAFNEKQRAKDEASRTAWAAIYAKRPPGAEAIILAEFEVDKCDVMSDYFATAIERTVAIGWRFGKREDFRQLRRAAANFAETAYLADAPADAEHRDNHSMGAGNYLKRESRYSTGWRIVSRSFSEKSMPWGGGPIEDGLPTGPVAPVVPASAVDVGGVKVSPSPVRDGYTELRFPGKPDAAVRDELKAAGFRWAPSSGCWYGPTSRLPAVYAPAPESFTCPQCGQRIDDGKPCGCGAR